MADTTRDTTGDCRARDQRIRRETWEAAWDCALAMVRGVSTEDTDPAEIEAYLTDVMTKARGGKLRPTRDVAVGDMTNTVGNAPVQDNTPDVSVQPDVTPQPASDPVAEWPDPLLDDMEIYVHDWTVCGAEDDAMAALKCIVAKARKTAPQAKPAAPARMETMMCHSRAGYWICAKCGACLYCEPIPLTRELCPACGLHIMGWVREVSTAPLVRCERWQDCRDIGCLHSEEHEYGG